MASESETGCSPLPSLPTPQKNQLMFSLGSPRGLKDQKTLTICYPKKRGDNYGTGSEENMFLHSCWRKRERKTCTQRELLASSWSWEESNTEAEPGQRLLVWWAGFSDSSQKAQAKKRKRERKKQSDSVLKQQTEWEVWTGWSGNWRRQLRTCIHIPVVGCPGSRETCVISVCGFST